MRAVRSSWLLVHLTALKSCEYLHQYSLLACLGHGLTIHRQLSGIGPKKLLSSFGIKTIVNLPGVGQNWQDQPSMFMQFSCKLLEDSLEVTTLTLRQTANIQIRRLTGLHPMQATLPSNSRYTTPTAQVSMQ